MSNPLRSAHDHLCSWNIDSDLQPTSAADFVSVDSLDQVINVPVLFVKF